MNDDMMKGWKLAREYYQVHGGVPPYPPPHVIEALKEQEAEPPQGPYTPQSGEAMAPNADWEGGMNPPDQVEERKQRRRKSKET